MTRDDKKPFDKAAYDRDYLKNRSVQKLLTISKENEADIITHLEQLDEPFTKYVKRLIREDMNRKAEQ